MKNNTRKILLAVLVVMTLLVSMATITASAADDSTVYLNPGEWSVDSPRYVAYTWADGKDALWIDMTDAGEGLFKATIPAGYTKVIFCRMDPASAENAWTNSVWNQTVDLDVYVDGTFTITDPWAGNGKSANGSWNGGTIVEGGNTGNGGSTGEGTTYTVAGVAGLCYSEWSTTDTVNDMTFNAETGLYEKTFTGIPADYYECKVAANHSWDQAWGGSAGDYGNYSFTTFEEHDITITFDPATGTVGHVLADSTGAAEDRPQPEKPDIDYEDTIIVYLSNSANWETPFVYFWTSGSTDQNAAWPGQEMEWDGEKMLFYVEVPTYYKNIIFSNSGNPQTADLSIPQQGGQYYDNGTGSWDDLKNFVPPVPPEDTTEEVTVYVKDDAGWGQVYIHFWSTTGVEPTTFPGTPMEKDENGYWVYTIPAENYGVLFTNGVNWDQPGAAQTCDLLIPTNGKVYISNANSCLYDDGIGNDNDAWYSVGENSGNTDNDNGNTGNNGGNTGNNGGNTGDNTPDVPGNDQPAKEMTFLQKLALKLLLFLRSIEEMFAGFFKK